jgi:hypothetical protein
MAETHSENRRIGYARVRTYGQTLDAQLNEATAPARQARPAQAPQPATTGAQTAPVIFDRACSLALALVPRGSGSLRRHERQRARSHPAAREEDSRSDCGRCRLFQASDQPRHRFDRRSDQKLRRGGKSG